jgi:hypothetical protein
MHKPAALCAHLQGDIFGKGQIHSTAPFSNGSGQAADLRQCLTGLPALISIPVHGLKASMHTKGHSIFAASGSMAVSNVAPEPGCHAEDSPLGPAAALAAALAEELQHWNATFPDSELFKVCKCFTYVPKEKQVGSWLDAHLAACPSHARCHTIVHQPWTSACTAGVPVTLCPSGKSPRCPKCAGQQHDDLLPFTLILDRPSQRHHLCTGTG